MYVDKRPIGFKLLQMRGRPVFTIVVWNVGVQSGVQRWQNSQVQRISLS